MTNKTETNISKCPNCGSNKGYKSEPYLKIIHSHNGVFESKLLKIFCNSCNCCVSTHQGLMVSHNQHNIEEQNEGN